MKVVMTLMKSDRQYDRMGGENMARSPVAAFCYQNQMTLRPASV
jgi:hypothetical protein